GLDDERVALSATLYPQPFGFEAEWTWGEGPELNSALTAVEVESLHGGYLQVNALIETSKGPLFPFVRWNYFDGARKFRANAPSDEVNELDFGVEWTPWPELELSVMYTHTFERTNTTDTSGPAFYERTEDADRLAFQLQWNY
ncbi:MAG: porin, partial [Planctomycetota bacterium]